MAFGAHRTGVVTMPKKISQPSSMERRIAARANPRFEPTDEQIEKAAESARNSYRANGSLSEAQRWECAAEAALRSITVAEVVA